MRFTILLTGLVVTVWLAGSPARAAELFTSYKADQIKAIFTDLGATEMKQEEIDGDPRLTFKIGEAIYVADFYKCADKANGCRMLHFVVSYDPEPTDTVETVNSYNSTYVFGKASFSKADGLNSYRAVIWAPGASKELIVAEFLAFREATAALLSHMKNNVVASGSGLPFVDRSPAFANVALISPKPRTAPRNKR